MAASAEPTDDIVEELFLEDLTDDQFDLNEITTTSEFPVSVIDSFLSMNVNVSSLKLVLVAFSGDGRINRFDQSTWVVYCGGQETEGRNEMQMNKELKAKCVPVRASRFYPRRI